MVSGMTKPITRLAIITVLGVFLAALLVGCNGATRTSATYGKIESAKITENERALLKSVGVENYFVFDYSLKDVKEKWVEYWVDSYEKGQQKQKGFGGKFAVDNPGTKTGRLVFSISSTGNGDEKWVFSYANGGNSTSASHTHKEIQTNMASTMTGLREMNFEAGQTIPLVVIARNKGGSVGLSEMIFQSENAMEETLKNDYVYVLRCRFTDKE